MIRGQCMASLVLMAILAYTCIINCCATVATGSQYSRIDNSYCCSGVGSVLAKVSCYQCVGLFLAMAEAIATDATELLQPLQRTFCNHCNGLFVTFALDSLQPLQRTLCNRCNELFATVATDSLELQASMAGHGLHHR